MLMTARTVTRAHCDQKVIRRARKGTEMRTRRSLLGAAAGAWLAVSGIAATAAGKMGLSDRAPDSALDPEGAMPSLEGAVEWLNSKPLGAADLAGKVVLVEFGTYTCINWQRTLPHVTAWAAKYRDRGLVTVVVHTPEFSFEHDLDNVRKAVSTLNLAFPVAVDSDGAIWRAFANEYWPALYFVDARGTIRHHRFGEGRYEESERVIQQLLTEAGVRDFGAGLVQVEGAGPLAAGDWANLRSEETYVGGRRAENFASAGGLAIERTKRYALPQRLNLNTWALGGEWKVESEAARVQEAGGRIAFRFHARDLHLVMGPTMRGSAVPFRVLLDGKPPASAHGTDVDADGRGMVVEPRMYQLIRQPAPIAERRFEIEFLEAGAAAYSFTFG
jgi:thiol-disulfide isomerase/thioredoxin